MTLPRRRALAVTADGASNQTGWISLKEGGVVTVTGTITGAITLQRRDAAGVISDVTNNSGVITTFTAVGTYTIGPNKTRSEYRLNAKSGAISGVPFNMSIEGS